MILTQSELTTAQRCKRKWWLTHYRKLRRKGWSGTPLSVGNIVHDGLEAYYKGEDPLEAVEAAGMALVEEHPDDADEILKALEMSGVMLEGYLEWVEAEGVDSDLDVYAAEQMVEVPIVGHTLRGKLDARARRRSDGFHAQIEHKTAANLTDIPKTAQGNFQFLTYDLLAYLASLEDPAIERTDGVILNILRKVKRTASARPPFYARHDVRHNVHELRAHWQHVVSIIRDIERMRDRLDAGVPHHQVVPPNPKKDCSWDCPFNAVCTLFDDGSNIDLALGLQYEEHDPLERYGV